MRAVLCAVFALTVAGLRADEVKVELKDLPKAVADAAKKRFPKGEVKEAAKETEDGKTVFEVTLTDAGQKIDVTLTPEGVLVGFEKQIDPKELPKVVSDAVEAKYPKAARKFLEQVIKVKDGKETLAYYEVLLQAADGSTVEIEVGTDGKILKTELKPMAPAAK